MHTQRSLRTPAMQNHAIINAMLTPVETSTAVNSIDSIDASRVRHIVLDIGNVIVRWDPHALLATAFDEPHEQQQALADTIAHDDWIEMDRGTLSMAEATARAQQRSRLAPERIKRVYDNLAQSLTPLAGTMDAMQRASERGISLYILSNMQEHAWTWLQQSYACWENCQGVVVSCETGYVKPEPEIYAHLTDRFALEPTECVFVDDVAMNIEAARAVGWQGVQLTQRELGGQIIDELAALVATG